MQSEATTLITALGLQSHPEGGAFGSVYESPLQISVPWSTSTRPSSTLIYFLLRSGEISRLHRLQADEVWAFHKGGPLEVVEIDATTGEVFRTLVGPDLEKGHKLTHVIPAGRWFGSRPGSGADFVLVSCFVSPGFVWDDFEMASRAALLETLPPASHDAVFELTPSE
jgi:predicted cupin superfamily sugar epimerase